MWVLCLWLTELSPPLRGVGGWGPLPAAARAHAGLRTRRGRARARALAAPAPRSEPPSLPQSAPRGHRRLPRPGALSEGPAPLSWSQEDELEEDVWAREYRGGGGSSELVDTECGRKTVPGSAPFPRAALYPRPGSPPRTPAPAGEPLPQAPPQGEREGGRERKGASELGRRSTARAATGSLGNGCHSNGVALPGNAAAGQRRSLPPLPPPYPTRGLSPRALGDRGCRDSSGRNWGNLAPLAHLGVPPSTAG